MAKSYIEKRVIKAGAQLCIERIERKGTPISADDIRGMKVRTFSPVLQAVYVMLGLALFVFGMWVQFESGNMALSMGLVLIGFLNVAYGVHGAPKPVSQIEGLDLMDLTAEITRSFTESQDRAREAGES